MVVWITGISGAGKTTLSQALQKQLKPKFAELILLDGEIVREISGVDLGYSEDDRIVQVGRVQKLVKLLSDQGMVVLVAVLYSNPELLARNRKIFDRYFEVHVDAPLWLVKKRDPKGLYQKAESGIEHDVVGIDIPWCKPSYPDFTVDAAIQTPAEELAQQIVAKIPYFASQIGAQRG